MQSGAFLSHGDAAGNLKVFSNRTFILFYKVPNYFYSTHSNEDNSNSYQLDPLGLTSTQLTASEATDRLNIWKNMIENAYPICLPNGECRRETLPSASYIVNPSDTTGVDNLILHSSNNIDYSSCFGTTQDQSCTITCLDGSINIGGVNNIDYYRNLYKSIYGVDANSNAAALVVVTSNNGSNSSNTTTTAPDFYQWLRTLNPQSATVFCMNDELFSSTIQTSFNGVTSNQPNSMFKCVFATCIAGEDIGIPRWYLGFALAVEFEIYGFFAICGGIRGLQIAVFVL